MSLSKLPDVNHALPRIVDASTFAESSWIDAGMNMDSWNPSMLSAINWLDDPSFLHLPLSGAADSLDLFLDASNIAETTEVTPGSADTAQLSLDSLEPSALADSPLTATTVLSSAAVTDERILENAGDNTTQQGALYVDGEPARLPRVKRRKVRSAARHSTAPSSNARFSLQSILVPENLDETSYLISESAYQQVDWLYCELCEKTWPGNIAFESGPCPPKRTIEILTSLGLKNVMPTMPTVHSSVLPQISTCPSMILAMAAIGAQFTDSSDSVYNSVSLHEFLSRVQRYEAETRQSHRPTCSEDTPAWLEKVLDRAAGMFHLLGKAYCGAANLRQQAVQQQSELGRAFAEVCKDYQAFKLAIEHEAPTWQTWLQGETLVRQAYCAWLIDCMWTYQLQSKPRLSLTECHLPLPCSEDLWAAGNEHEWRAVYASQPEQVTLQQALQRLFVDKELSPKNGEFAHILIINGVFHRLWEVETYLENPLSHWTPTAQRRASTTALPTAPIWMPADPTFKKWQNSACDCIDILHWQANAMIGQARGLEHPTVFHLHHSRLVLLTPYRDIINLVCAMTTPDTISSSSALSSKQAVQRWALQHQYKARLAAVHAGVVFWHIRKFSIDAFYEGPAVALAAMVLWAFGTLANTTVRADQIGNNGQDDANCSDESTCSIILLDRPTDDELVQQFIRHGNSMQAHLSGVGDLYAVKGPRRILAQGVKLLSSLPRWGVNESWLRLLKDLLVVVQTTSRSAATV